MSGSDDFEPGFSVDFFRTENFANLIVEDFGGGSGEGIDTRSFESSDDLGEGEVVFSGDELDFLGGEGVEVEVGEVGFDGFDEFEVVGQGGAVEFGFGV